MENIDIYLKIRTVIRDILIGAQAGNTQVNRRIDR